MQLLSIAVFLYGVIQVSLGCSCAWYPRMPFWQSQLCSALKYNDNGFVIKAKVVGDRTEVYPNSLFSPVYYEINPTAKFGNKLGSNVNTSRVYTASDGALCGISLNKDETYVLSGHINNNGELWVLLCNFFGTWSSITNTELQRFVVNKNAKDCPDPSCFCYYEAKPNEPFWKSLICKAYQQNGFVLVAQITGDRTSEPEPCYDITVTGSQNELDADISKVYTKANGRCDVLLTVGNKYILTGTVEAGKLVVEGCSYYKLWFDASEEEKQYVNNPKQFCE